MHGGQKKKEQSFGLIHPPKHPTILDVVRKYIRQGRAACWEKKKEG